MKKFQFVYLSIISGWLLLPTSCKRSEVVPPAVVADSCTMQVTYQLLRPMLMRYCNDCHTRVSPRVASYDALRVGALENGKFVHRVIERRDMPEGIALTEAEFDSLRCWAEAGFPAN